MEAGGGEDLKADQAVVFPVQGNQPAGADWGFDIELTRDHVQA